ncbi:MAG: hypothetical protein ACSHW0_06475 [Thalassotalea sp.]
MASKKSAQRNHSSRAAMYSSRFLATLALLQEEQAEQTLTDNEIKFWGIRDK